ncbi:MAG TPA: hypothetical protein PKA28_06125 [Methylomusa anaerophila]|uniref:Uncharacterized protein n=1 Tax=Methylomusa anaerophila TaxID=1930071 RepID=A0A348ALM9_9FIRM|nr:hypothetical protein [Methylomusa anaerophila]BBB91977.1 hypothetical protein MAMMFC1_02662 [Methylomusa anaerophila]HML88010.1 hypothetical protein [Methylomusa anaerophila]
MNKHSWVLKDSWEVENGWRLIFTNKPDRVHFIDITLPQEIDPAVVSKVETEQWSTTELIQYLNQLVAR